MHEHASGTQAAFEFLQAHFKILFKSQNLKYVLQMHFEFCSQARGALTCASTHILAIWS
jgi:hypothetical protein